MLTNDLEGLRLAVKERPMDAVLRLVYADALEESGEERDAGVQRATAELLATGGVGPAPPGPTVNYITKMTNYPRKDIAVRLATDGKVGLAREGYRRSGWTVWDFGQQNMRPLVEVGPHHGAIELGAGRVVIQYLMGLNNRWATAVEVVVHPDDYRILLGPLPGKRRQKKIGGGKPARRRTLVRYLAKHPFLTCVQGEDEGLLGPLTVRMYENQMRFYRGGVFVTSLDTRSGVVQFMFTERGFAVRGHGVTTRFEYRP